MYILSPRAQGGQRWVSGVDGSLPTTITIQPSGPAARAWTGLLLIGWVVVSPQRSQVKRVSGLAVISRALQLHDAYRRTYLMNMQQSPFPSVLADLVSRLEYRKWFFRLEELDRGQGSAGLTLIVQTLGYDSYHPEDGEGYRVNHYMPVPPAAYNEQSWRRWLFEQCLLIERHECCEFFKIDGKRPYAPHHGPGNDPYVVFERGTDLEARTLYTGEVNERKEKLRSNQKQ